MDVRIMVDMDGSGGNRRLPNSDTGTHPVTRRIECFEVSRNRRFLAALDRRPPAPHSA